DPAFDGRNPVARIDADDDPARMSDGGIPYERGVAQRRRPQHDAVDPEHQPVLDRRTVADSAAELDWEIDGAADCRHGGAVPRMASDRTVEVDDVQPGKTGVGEIPRLRRRIPVEDSGARHIAADEAHAGALFQVNRREQDHSAAAALSRSL